MQKSIEKLLDIFNSNQFEKEEYLDALDECDEVIYDFLKDKNYRNETNVNLFRISTDERLSIAQNKMQLCEDNPNYALKEVVKSKMQHLETFVDKYRIGFIQSAELQETGYVKVTIPCLITARNYFDNPHTAKQVFKAQIQFLKDKGFIIEKDDMGYYFENNETNISLFKRILADRKCKHIEIKTLDSRIRMLSFIIHINDIDKMNEVVTKIEVLKTDILNEDEKIILKKNIDEIKFAKSFLEINDIRTEASCCSLIESYFSEICKIFSFKGKVLEMHEERFFDESSKNAKIQNIEDDILKICNSIDIVENLKNIKSKLDDFCAEKICFYVSKFYFDKYGILNVECKYITNPVIIMKTNCISEEELKDTFSTTVGNRFDENLYILDDFENKIKIETIFKKLVEAIYVKDVSVSKKNETYVISGFTAFADEIIELIS